MAEMRNNPPSEVQGRLGLRMTRLIEGVEADKGLDPVAKQVQQAVHTTYRAAGPVGQRVANLLYGVWLGHPLHPVLVATPIGAWSVAFVLDLLEANGAREVGPGADAAVAVGLAGGLGAAAAGLTDWQHVTDKPRRVGFLHALLNVTTTLLYLISWLLRRRGDRAAGRAVGWLAYSGLMAGGYLGGELVGALHIGVDRTAEQTPPKDWVPVLAAADLPENTLKRADANGMPVLLVRRGSRIHAISETCTHLGGPLAKGKLLDGAVVCPWHQSRFSLEDGRVLDGPATFPATCFETRVQEGQIQLRVAQRVGGPA